MELTSYISKDKIAVGSQKTVEQVLSIFANISYAHVPIIHKNKFIGNIAKQDLFTINNTSQKLEELEHLYELFFAKEEDLLLEVFSKFSANNTNVMPIVDAKNNYIGYLDLNDVLDCFSNTDFLNLEGNVLLLEKNSTEFSMSEVCQIVEANNNAVLGCFVSRTDENRTNITLKVKPININELIQSLRRYDYSILNNLTEDTYLESLKNRSEYFIKFLKI